MQQKKLEISAESFDELSDKISDRIYNFYFKDKKKSPRYVLGLSFVKLSCYLLLREIMLLDFP